MFAEELAKIKESEEKAEQLQKAAKTQAKQALAEAKSKAEHKLEEAEKKAQEIKDALHGEGQDISDEQYRAFMAQTEKDCADMIAKGQENADKAVQFIAERIVSTSVNR